MVYISKVYPRSGDTGQPSFGGRDSGRKTIGPPIATVGLPDAVQPVRSTASHRARAKPSAAGRVHHRFNRTLREEALNHFLFLSFGHIRRVLDEYARYYNGARPSQATHAIPAPYPALREPPPVDGKVVALPVLGGNHHDYRIVA